MSIAIANAAKEMVVALEAFKNNTYNNDTPRQLVAGIKSLAKVLQEDIFPIMETSDRVSERDELDAQIRNMLVKTGELLGQLNSASLYALPSPANYSFLTTCYRVPTFVADVKAMMFALIQKVKAFLEKEKKIKNGMASSSHFRF